MELTKNINKKSFLKKIIKNYKYCHIIVIGDIILDRYIFTSVDRISPEAPIPIAKVINEKDVLGGACNVAANLAELGICVDLIGIIGNDNYGDKIASICNSKRIGIKGLIKDNKASIVKSRILCNSQQLLRIDREDIYHIEPSIEKKIIETIKSIIRKNTHIIFSDYAKHFFSEDFHKQLIQLQYQSGIKLFADTKPKNIDKFRGAYFIKPNRKEAESIAKTKIKEDFSNLKEICLLIQNTFNTNVMITLSQHGLAVLYEKEFIILPTYAKDVYDVSGAGDTTLATFVASIAAGADIRTAAQISNLCAGIVVSKLGTSICELKELEERLINFNI